MLIGREDNFSTVGPQDENSSPAFWAGTLSVLPGIPLKGEIGEQSRHYSNFDVENIRDVRMISFFPRHSLFQPLYLR